MTQSEKIPETTNAAADLSDVYLRVRQGQSIERDIVSLALGRRVEDRTTGTAVQQLVGADGAVYIHSIMVPAGKTTPARKLTEAAGQVDYRELLTVADGGGGKMARERSGGESHRHLSIIALGGRNRPVDIRAGDVMRFQASRDDIRLRVVSNRPFQPEYEKWSGFRATRENWLLKSGVLLRRLGSLWRWLPDG